MDRREQELRKRVSEGGGKEAQAALNRHLERSGNLITILTYANIYVGDWAYIECGPNFHEIGKVERVGLDEIGRAIVVLSNHRRKQNEVDGQAPTFLYATVKGVVALPTTGITHCALAADRYGEHWEPWAA